MVAVGHGFVVSEDISKDRLFYMIQYILKPKAKPASNIFIQ